MTIGDRMMKTQKFEKLIRGLVAGAAAVSLLVGAKSAFAQAVESQQAGIGDIIVTAQRRTESVQKVPISIQVFTPEALERERILDTRDLAPISPSVNSASSALLGNSTFVLRGIASAAPSPGLQPSVAMVIAGVPVSNLCAFISGLRSAELRVGTGCGRPCRPGLS